MTEQTVVPLELRRANQGHSLTGICIPYGQVTHKAGYPGGERFAAGAFATAVNAPGKIRLTDSHQPGEARRPAGVATELTDTPQGLMGTFRFYDTPEGRGAWENAMEGTYGGLSVGFMALGERAAADGVREINEARLFHVALVDEPAYDGAELLAVRQAQPDDALAELLNREWSPEAFPEAPDVITMALRGTR